MNGGPCLANTSIQAPTSGNRGSIGQASFNYATTPGNEAAFSAVAGYQGSALCKAAPSQGSAMVPRHKWTNAHARLCIEVHLIVHQNPSKADMDHDRL